MSNRFTKYTADKLRLDGWLDKEQADHLRTQLKSVEAERDQYKHEAEMWDEHMGPITDYEGDEAPWQTIEREYSALKNDHESLLLRLQEAEWLLDHCPDSLDPNPVVNKQWWSRRDTFLNPKPQDVM